MRDDIDDAIREDIAEEEARGAPRGTVVEDTSAVEYRRRLAAAWELPPGIAEGAVCEVFDQVLANLTQAQTERDMACGTLASIEAELRRAEEAFDRIRETMA